MRRRLPKFVELHPAEASPFLHCAHDAAAAGGGTTRLHRTRASRCDPRASEREYYLLLTFRSPEEQAAHETTVM